MSMTMISSAALISARALSSTLDAHQVGGILLETSDPRIHLISRMRRLYRADPEVRPPGDLDQLWRTEIIQHIDEDMEPARRKIRDKSSRKPTKDTQFMPDLIMTGIAQIGAKQVLLTPCIWFFCGSLWCKRIVKEVAQDLKWPTSFGIHNCRFQVGGPVLAAYENEATGLEDLGLQIELEHGVCLPDQFTAYLHIQDPDSLPDKTTIGISCCATVTQNNTIISQKLARVAGVVEVEGLWCGQTSLGLTTCHNLVDACIDSLYQQDVLDIPPESHHDTTPSQGTHETTGADSDVDSDDYSDESSSTDDESGCEPATTSRKICRQVRAKWINVSQSVSGIFIGFSFGSPAMRGPGWAPRWRGVTDSPVTDVATFELPLQGHVYNTYRNPLGALINIRSHLNDEEVGLDEVYIVNDIGAAILAYPLAGAMHFCVRGKVMETVRLKCTQPLDVGSSGSCVVRGSAFCGLIVAVFPRTHYALMISAEHVFSGIKSIIPGVLHIRHATQLSPRSVFMSSHAGLHRTPVEHHSSQGFKGGGTIRQVKTGTTSTKPSQTQHQQRPLAFDGGPLDGTREPFHLHPSPRRSTSQSSHSSGAPISSMETIAETYAIQSSRSSAPPRSIHQFRQAGPSQSQMWIKDMGYPDASSTSSLRQLGREEFETEITSPDIRLTGDGLYLALPETHPPAMDDQEVAEINDQMGIALEPALERIKVKGRSRPWMESSLFIDMRMSGAPVEGTIKIKLKPCIWFFCGSKWCKEIVEQDVQQLMWIKGYATHFVHKGGPLLAAGENSADELSRDGLAGSSGPRDDAPSAADTHAMGSAWDQYPASATEDTHGTCHGPTPASGNGVNGSLPAPFRDEASSSVSSYDPSTASTAISSIPPRIDHDDLKHTIVQQQPPHVLYKLPCEFRGLTDCPVEFSGDDVAEWMIHIEDHLHGNFPARASCWFCHQTVFDSDSPSEGQRRANFRARLLHIRDHFIDEGLRPQIMRPDYFLIQHLKKEGLEDGSTLNDWLSLTEHLPSDNSEPTSCVRYSLNLPKDVSVYFHLEQAPTCLAIGLDCCLTVRQDQTIVSRKLSTLGGVVAVAHGSNLELYGLTTGHGFDYQHMTLPQGYDNHDVDKSDGVKGSTSPSNIDSEDSDDSDDSPQSPSIPAAKESLPWINVSHNLHGAFFGPDFEHLSRGVASSQQAPYHRPSAASITDIALFIVPREYGSPNFYKPSPLQQVVPIVSILEGEVAHVQEVSILAGSDRVVAGDILPGIFHFSIGGYKMHTVRLKTAENLGMGSSGSWVAKGGTLYGIIVAVFPAEPYALMVPARDVFSDIRTLFPNATSITVDIEAAQRSNYLLLRQRRLSLKRLTGQT